MIEQSRVNHANILDEDTRFRSRKRCTCCRGRGIRYLGKVPVDYLRISATLTLNSNCYSARMESMILALLALPESVPLNFYLPSLPTLQQGATQPFLLTPCNPSENRPLATIIISCELSIFFLRLAQFSNTILYLNLLSLNEQVPAYYI